MGTIDMKEQFCTYEISLKLKELGFDEDVLAYYTSEKKLKYTDSHLSIRAGQWLLKAPLWQQAIDCLREKHNLYININPPEHWRVQIDDMQPHQCSFIIRSYNTYIGESPNNPFALIRRSFESYDEAREAAILKAIELCKKI